MIPVILAGGAGTRLWPLSRELYPKQFLPLAEDRTMLQVTAERVSVVKGVGQPVVICNDEHRFLAGEQLQSISMDSGGIILEPVGRNTAPAAVLAALHAMESQDDPVILLLPADHVIRDEEGFCRAVEAGAKLAEEGSLLTFGIVPDRPETGYGYIRKGEALSVNQQGFNVDSFVEKPDLATATSYLESGEYLWNSGMFMFRASVLLDEVERFAPAILESCRKAFSGKSADLDFIRLAAGVFETCPSDSIDYAVMERTEKAVVMPLDCGWSDVGSWQSLHEVSSADEDGNVVNGDVLVNDVRNCYLRAESRLLTAVGLDDHIVVETADAVLVASKKRSQDVKAIVEKLRTSNRAEAKLHRKVYRPWGSYEGVDAADRFQVKRIIVKPGASLSLQKHHHRAEHWVVVNGTANVTVGEKVVVVSENESTYIPLGEKHRLENPGKIQLELIEIQTGSYLGEDDIVRYEDVYGRED